MLVAMAVTLVLMAALAQGFRAIGIQVRDSRAQVDLNARLRAVSLQLESDLSRCTVTFDAPQAHGRGRGYLVYYEGPVTNASPILFGQQPQTTAVELDDQTQLPSSRYGDYDDYLAFTAVAEGDNWFKGKVPRFLLDARASEISGTTVSTGDPLDPVVITSKYAEIIYFASPDYQTIADPDHVDQFRFVPDDQGRPQIIARGSDGTPVTLRLHRRVLLIRPDLNLESTGRLATHTNANGRQYMVPDIWPQDTGNQMKPGAANQAWLIGMADVHQRCDLSVRRSLRADGFPDDTPGNAVVANSLDDLTWPHNRFAHVRVPGSLLNYGGDAANITSMPVLALGQPDGILQRAAGGDALGRVGATGTQATYLNGFIRPEFILGYDHSHVDVVGDGWGLERSTEDVVLTNLLAFDVKAFDPEARVFHAESTTRAADGSAETTTVGPDDPGAFSLTRSTQTAHAIGGFVDLCYPLNAGGAIRGMNYGGTIQRDLIHQTPTTGGGVTQARADALFLTPLSGYFASNYGTAVAPLTTAFFKSGRCVRGQGGEVRLFQPAFDTFTDGYERDGFPQREAGNARGTVWHRLATGTAADVGGTGIEPAGLFETSAPFPTPLPALQVTLRIEDRTTRQVQQLSVSVQSPE